MRSTSFRTAGFMVRWAGAGRSAMQAEPGTATMAVVGQKALKHCEFSSVISMRLFSKRRVHVYHAPSYFGEKKYPQFGMKILRCRNSIWENVGKLRYSMSSQHIILLPTFIFRMIILYNIHL